MVSSVPETSTRRPSSSRGPRRDAERDHLIVEAVLDLLARDGFDALTMEGVALRAGVAKATVYRRWATKTDLCLEALSSLGGGPVGIPAGTEPTLRAELVGVLSAATGCDDQRRHEVVVALAEGSRRHPELGQAFERQLMDQMCGLRAVVDRAADRGEITARRHGELLDPRGDQLEITTGPALALFHFLASGRRPDTAFVEQVVDRVVLPLLRG